MEFSIRLILFTFLTAFVTTRNSQPDRTLSPLLH